jgi:hypothetical protein
LGELSSASAVKERLVLMNDVSTVNIQWVSEQWLIILDNTPFGAQLLERFQTTLDGALLACPKLRTSLRQSDLLKV